MRWICMLRTSASHRLRSKSWTAPFPRRLCSGSALSVSWILARCHRGWVNYLGEVDESIKCAALSGCLVVKQALRCEVWVFSAFQALRDCGTTYRRQRGGGSNHTFRFVGRRPQGPACGRCCSSSARTRRRRAPVARVCAASACACRRQLPSAAAPRRRGRLTAVCGVCAHSAAMSAATQAKLVRSGSERSGRELPLEAHLLSAAHALGLPRSHRGSRGRCSSTRARAPR